MTTSATPFIHPAAVRREADRLAASGRGERFRRRRLEHSRDGEAVVLAAVTRAKAGDAEAMRLLYLRYADNVYGYVCSIVRDEHEAEDVTQQIFAKLMTAVQRYEPRSVPFSAWILRIAHNAAIDHMRARRAVPCEEVRPVDTRADDWRQCALLREAFGALRATSATSSCAMPPSPPPSHAGDRGARAAPWSPPPAARRCAPHQRPGRGSRHPLAPARRGEPAWMLPQLQRRRGRGRHAVDLTVALAAPPQPPCR